MRPRPSHRRHRSHRRGDGAVADLYEVRDAGGPAGLREKAGEIGVRLFSCRGFRLGAEGQCFGGDSGNDGKFARESAGIDGGGGPGHVALGAARVARLCGRARQLALRGRDANHQGQRQPAGSRVDAIPPARPTSTRSSSAASSMAGAPTTRFVALDAATGQASCGSHPGVTGYNVRGVNYWESKDGRRSPADLQRQQHAPGDRRADRRSAITTFGTAGRSISGSGSTAIRRRSISRAARRAAFSRTC